MRLDVAGRSDAGRVRPRNEDRFAFTPAAPDGALLCVVADGMGGHAAGDLAATLAVEQLQAAVQRGAGLRAAIASANAAIYARAAAEPARRGMGTTIACALLGDGRARYAHCGDSRLYLVRRGAAHQLTADHSWVAEEVRAGRLSPEEARRSRARHLVTRALGVSPEVTADEGSCALSPGDAIVLCSDGVSGPVEDAEIAAACAQPADRACAQLVELANARGGEDNATVVVARVLDDVCPGERRAVPRPRQESRGPEGQPGGAVGREEARRPSLRWAGW
jgi:protein phosphatase